jgi:hypothetical protein
MSKRYGSLPSKVMREADTLDVFIINTATAWEQYQNEVAQARAGGKATPAPKVPLDRLQQMMDTVKGHSNDSKKS